MSSSQPSMLLEPLLAAALVLGTPACIVHRSASWYEGAEIRSLEMPLLGPGPGTVLEYERGSGLPFPDAFRTYRLWIELSDASLELQQRIAFPQPGVRGVLLEEALRPRSGEARGEAVVLALEEGAVELQLDVRCPELDWRYSGRVRFLRGETPSGKHSWEE